MLLLFMFHKCYRITVYILSRISCITMHVLYLNQYILSGCYEIWTRCFKPTLNICQNYRLCKSFPNWCKLHGLYRFNIFAKCCSVIQTVSCILRLHRMGINRCLLTFCSTRLQLWEPQTGYIYSAMKSTVSIDASGNYSKRNFVWLDALKFRMIMVYFKIEWTRVCLLLLSHKNYNIFFSAACFYQGV